MKDKLKIISNGTPHGTSVLHNGKLLKNITRIEILPITPDSGDVQARITFVNVDLDIVVEPPKNEKVKILQWIYDRLVHRHKENPNVDYMIKLKGVIDNEAVKNP